MIETLRHLSSGSMLKHVTLTPGYWLLNADTMTIRYNKAWLTVQIAIALLIGSFIVIALVTDAKATDDVDRLGDLEIWAFVFCLAMCAYLIWENGGIVLKSSVSTIVDHKAIQLRNGTSLDLCIDWHDVKAIKPVIVSRRFGNVFKTIEIHLK